MCSQHNFYDGHVYICVIKVSKGQRNFKKRKTGVENGLDEGKSLEGEALECYRNHERTRAGAELCMGVEGRRERVWDGGGNVLLVLYSGHPVYMTTSLIFQQKRGKSRWGCKGDKPAELFALLRRNQVNGPMNKGHRYRPGLQAENGCDMKFTPHNDELESALGYASVLQSSSVCFFSEDIDSSIRFL